MQPIKRNSQMRARKLLNGLITMQQQPQRRILRNKRRNCRWLLIQLRVNCTRIKVDERMILLRMMSCNPSIRAYSIQFHFQCYLITCFWIHEVQIWFQNAVQSYISMSTYNDRMAASHIIQVIATCSSDISGYTDCIITFPFSYRQDEIMGQKSLRVWRLAQNVVLANVTFTY